MLDKNIISEVFNNTSEIGVHSNPPNLSKKIPKHYKNDFYNYIYLDPRKPGKFTYENVPFSFLYEPFYIGKGTRGRFKAHLKVNERSNKHNPHKQNKINNLKEYNMIKYILLLNFNTNENTYKFENFLVRSIGRVYEKKGPLVNKDFGGCKGKGNSWSKIKDKRISHVSDPDKVIDVYSMAEFAREQNLNVSHISSVFIETSIHADGWFLPKNRHLIHTIYHKDNVKLAQFILEKDNIEYKIRTLAELGVKDTTGINWLLSGFVDKIRGFKLNAKNKDLLIPTGPIIEQLKKMTPNLLKDGKTLTPIELFQNLRDNNIPPNEFLSNIRKYKSYKDIIHKDKKPNLKDEETLTVYKFNPLTKSVEDVTFKFKDRGEYIGKRSQWSEILKGNIKRVGEYYVEREACILDYEVVNLKNDKTGEKIKIFKKDIREVFPDGGYNKLLSSKTGTYRGWRKTN